MSDKALKWAHEKVKTTDSNLQLLLYVMAMRADHKGALWPSQAWMKERSALSESTIKRTIRKMKKAGMVIVSAKQQGKHRTVNRYQLAIDKTFTSVERVTQTPSNDGLNGSHRPLQNGGGGQAGPFKGVTVTPNIGKGTSNYINTKYNIYIPWQPEEQIIKMLANDFEVPEGFTWEQLPTFLMYWIETGGSYTKTVWHEKFVAHVLKNWQWGADAWNATPGAMKMARDWAK